MNGAGGTPGRAGYQPEHADLVRKFALLGAKNNRIAELLGIKHDLFEQWLVDYPELAVALNQGREHADAEVVDALFKRARGWVQPGVRLHKMKDGETEYINRTDVVEHFPPDVGAIKFWLANRQQDLWQDRSEVGVTVQGGGISEMLAAARTAKAERDRTGGEG